MLFQSADTVKGRAGGERDKSKLNPDRTKMYSAPSPGFVTTGQMAYRIKRSLSKEKSYSWEACELPLLRK